MARNLSNSILLGAHLTQWIVLATESCDVSTADRKARPILSYRFSITSVKGHRNPSLCGLGNAFTGLERVSGG